MPGEVVQPLLAAFLLALLATAFHRRWPPTIAARYLVVVIAVLLIAAVPTVVLVALTFVIHIPIVGEHVRWCTHVVGHHDQVPTWLGVVDAALLLVGVTRMGRVLADHRRLACHASGEHHRGCVEIDDDPGVWAVTLPGSAGRIVVSSGMITAIDERETEVVIAHERAHARFRHDRYILFGELAAALVPPLRWLTSRLRFSVERWADEAAAEECGDRRFVAHTIGRVALIASPVGLAPGFVGSGVVGRVRLMLAPPVVRVCRGWLFTIGAGSALVVASALFQWHHLGALMSSFCHD